MALSHQTVLRLAAYWGTAIAGCWSLAYFYACGTEKGREWYREDLSENILAGLEIRSGTGSRMIAVASPLLILASLSALVVTSTPLPVWRTSWINKFFGRIKKFKHQPTDQDGGVLVKKNQFAVGEINFNILSIFLIVLPLFAYFIASVDRRLSNPEEPVSAEHKMHTIANITGIVGILALAFFLVPVTRHSILLVAMGWSPIHALRIHVWAGFTSFFFIFIHSILCMVDWWAFNDKPVWDQIIPDKECWSWNPPGEERLSRSCRKEWYNITGIFSFLFFIILVASSLNWFRRRYYRLFYIFHVVFGTAMLFTAILHWRPLATYVLPSIMYYLASTIPTIAQAFASRFRGGVKIVKVVPLGEENGGGCIEVQVAVNHTSAAAFKREPCMFVKLNVPKISVVWHPFTVYQHPEDPTTVRFLFRPIGPFTKRLSECLLLSPAERPTCVLDGFYRGGDRSSEALQHDHITIAAGGVAITPFLSMIPSLFYKLGQDSDRLTHRIVLHWVCREPGLVRFVQEQYIEPMTKTAQSHSIDFTAHIYQTAKQHVPIKKSDETEVVEDTVRVALGESENGSNEGEELALVEEEGSQHDLPTEEVGNVPEASIPVRTAILTKAKGFEMELARMMPARESLVWRNLPLFVAVSFGIWVGYYLIFHWYQSREVKYNELYARGWGTLVCLLVIIAFSILMEIILVHCRKYWPSPPENCMVVIDDVDGGQDAENVETHTVGSMSVHHHVGRPSVETLMAGAQQAEAPGIFICGPVAMREAIKAAAHKDNSALGLTRFCLYEEHFEM